MQAHAALHLRGLQQHAIVAILGGDGHLRLLDQARADLDQVLARTTQDVHGAALRQQEAGVQAAARFGGRAKADLVGAGFAAMDADLGRQQAAVDGDRRGLAVAGAVIAVGAQIHALAGRDQAARQAAGRPGDAQVIARQQAGHAGHADDRVSRQLDVAAHAGGRRTRHQPGIARFDPAHIERQRLRLALGIVGLAELHQRHVAAGPRIEGG